MYKPQIKVRGKHGDKPDKSELYDKYCRTSHEVRGLKSVEFSNRANSYESRTSHEVRGLKYDEIKMLEKDRESHLTRGAWIEIRRQRLAGYTRCSRTSHEVRGLKYSRCFYNVGDFNRSHLTRGAWIEIF